MLKKLATYFQELKGDRRQTIFVIVLMCSYFSYCVTRTVYEPDFIVGWFGGVYFGVCALNHTRFSKFIRRYTKVVLVFLTIAFFFYSAFYYRTNSWDGGNLYYRNAFLVKEKGHSAVLQGAIYPYFSELFLGLIGRIFNDNFMFFMFGLASVICIYSSYLIYKRLSLSPFVTRYALLIFITSPTFIMLSLHEFKVELFLLLLYNFFTLQLISCIQHPSTRNIIILGLLASFSFLTKVSVLPLIIISPCFLLIVKIVRKELITKKAILHLATFSLAVCLPIFLWVLYTPTLLPIIGVLHPRSTGTNVQFTDLERDSGILAECRNQERYRDLSGWIFYKNELWLLIQPIQYFLFVGLERGQFVFHTGNPGPYIYLGIWLTPLVAYLFYMGKKYKQWTIFASSIPFIIAIYYLSKGVFWYYFPIYPILAAVIPFLAERYINTRFATSVFKVTVLSLAFTHVLWGFGAGITLFGTFGFNSSLETSSPVIWNLSKTAQNLPADFFIMDATQHQFITFLPFMNNYDTRIVRSDFYFASSKKNIDDMRQELLVKNIKYIIARKSTLFNSWYAGCPLRNNEILFQFLEKHTKMIYDSIYVGEIYEVI